MIRPWVEGRWRHHPPLTPCDPTPLPCILHARSRGLMLGHAAHARTGEGGGVESRGRCAGILTAQKRATPSYTDPKLAILEQAPWVHLRVRRARHARVMK